MGFKHIPVLLDEVIEALDIKQDGAYLDCTAGGGGHSYEIAKRLLSGKGALICLDRDPEAIEAAKERLSPFADKKIKFINTNFSEMENVINKEESKFDGILMDLGVSSHQLDEGRRGFSYHEDAPLDMRMSGEGISACDVVNLYPAAELERILFRYGEEKYARGITAGIIKAREKSPIRTTGELADIIANNVPLRIRKEKNPCRKTFQAIRIEVNGELDSLEKGIPAAFGLLKTGGRLAVISFHSIEDRLVKEKFREYTTGCTCNPDFPICICGKVPEGRLILRKPVTAGEEELTNNRRSRSAKLRVIEKLGEGKDNADT